MLGYKLHVGSNARKKDESWVGIGRWIHEPLSRAFTIAQGHETRNLVKFSWRPRQVQKAMGLIYSDPRYCRYVGNSTTL